MITFVIGSYKGGTGKTTSTVNLAYNTAENHRVLVIDADPQANATYMLSNMSNGAKTLKDIFNGKPIRSCIRRSRFRGISLDIIKSTSEIEELSGDPEILRNALAAVNDDYDYCFIDTHPSMQLPTIAAMIAADFMLIPFRPDGYSQTGLTMLDDYISQIRALYNPNLQFYVFVTQFERRKSQLAVIQELAEKYDYPLLDNVISRGEAVNSAILLRRPLAMHRKKDRVTQDYHDLTNEILSHAALSVEEAN